jgi:hypothetical protein
VSVTVSAVGDGVNRPRQRRGAAWLGLDDDAGRLVLDDGEGIMAISTTGAVLSGNAACSFPSYPSRLPFSCSGSAYLGSCLSARFS